MPPISTVKFWDAPVCDPQSLIAMGNEYFRWKKRHGTSEYGIKQRRHRLKYFVSFCHERAIYKVNEVSRAIIDGYQRYLYYMRRSTDKKPYSPSYRMLLLNVVIMFFRWLTTKDYILDNPACAIELPKLPKKIPSQVLSVSQAELIMQQPDISTPLGIRDRAILETLYSTGIRRGELHALNVEDIDFEQGIIMIRGAKGEDNRLIPIGDRALEWIERYLQVRSSMLVDSQARLFITHRGKICHMAHLSNLVYKYVRSAGIDKRGSCHLFRHTTAALMLENGADIRYIQQMLGHRDIRSTQVYTKISINKLKQVHTLTHPAKTEPTQTRTILREIEK